MGYLAVEFAMAGWRGVTSLPVRVPTGYAVITAENVDDPESPGSSIRFRNTSADRIMGWWGSASSPPIARVYEETL